MKQMIQCIKQWSEVRIEKSHQEFYTGLANNFTCV